MPLSPHLIENIRTCTTSFTAATILLLITRTSPWLSDCSSFCSYHEHICQGGFICFDNIHPI